MYRGGEGMWSWILHRVTGVAVLLFLLAHIVDTMLIGFGPRVYNLAIGLYRKPFFRIGEVLLASAVLFHAINGIRIMIIDFFPGSTVFQRRLFYGGIVLFFALFLPGAYYMLRPVFFQ